MRKERENQIKKELKKLKGNDAETQYRYGELNSELQQLKDFELMGQGFEQ